MSNRAAAVARYNEHTQQVIDTVPQERLLVFRASDGWQPLCEFLSEPTPSGPFPRTNDRAQLRRKLQRVGSIAYVLIGVPLALLGGVIWFVL